MRRCTSHGRRLCAWCVVQSLAFPLEHVVWERLPIFRSVSALLGLA